MISVYESRVAYCTQKIVELLQDKTIPFPLANFRIKYWEYQIKIAEYKINSFKYVNKTIEKEEKMNRGYGDIPSIHDGGEVVGA